ncbi:MAG: hypothetical protein FWE04_03335 [Oscillospiraceae bacterium]|nr:hypothetical protein [Oscillospiraceae bacterium]
MERTIEDALLFNDLLFNFEFIREAFGLSEEAMDYIADLIISGRDMEEIIHITYFWLETNEDISIIGEIYDMKDEFAGSSFWLEFAFNRITGNRHGVLTDEEAVEYLEMGLDFDDLEIARVLSRQGVMTIHEILDERAEDVSFSELAAEIDSESVPQRGRSRGDRSRVRVNRENASRHRNLRNQSDVLMSRRLSMITGENLEVFLEAAASLDYEALEVMYDAAVGQISQEIMMNLNERGVLRRPRYGFPGQEEVVAQLRSEIMDNGVSEAMLNALFEEGFEYMDILNASSISNATNGEIREILERLINGESWIQIIDSLTIGEVQ